MLHRDFTVLKLNDRLVNHRRSRNSDLSECWKLASIWNFDRFYPLTHFKLGQSTAMCGSTVLNRRLLGGYFFLAIWTFRLLTYLYSVIRLPYLKQTVGHWHIHFFYFKVQKCLKRPVFQVTSMTKRLSRRWKGFELTFKLLTFWL